MQRSRAERIPCVCGAPLVAAVLPAVEHRAGAPPSNATTTAFVQRGGDCEDRIRTTQSIPKPPLLEHQARPTLLTNCLPLAFGGHRPIREPFRHSLAFISKSMHSTAAAGDIPFNLWRQ